MQLFIQVEDDAVVNHPAYEDNLIEAFGAVPATWEPFTRVQQPVPDTYQVLDSPVPSYEKISGVWTDIWPLRDMSGAEKTAKQDAVKADWEANGFDSWTFNEDTCSFDPPEPYPDDGKLYRWDEDSLSWVEV